MNWEGGRREEGGRKVKYRFSYFTLMAKSKIRHVIFYPGAINEYERF
ncbi:MAG: hypothetical protein JXB88_21095 [Spirochaetales bacterium]|nr:hypothetical protein [Spirochaetales bacterium]